MSSVFYYRPLPNERGERNCPVSQNQAAVLFVIVECVRVQVCVCIARQEAIAPPIKLDHDLDVHLTYFSD